VDAPILSYVGLWNANAIANFTATSETQWIEEASASEDGTMIAAGGSTPGIEQANAELVDFNLHAMGYIEQHFGVMMPTGTPSFFLDPTGALLYKAGTNDFFDGVAFPGGRIEIDDTHTYEPAASISLADPFVTSYTPLTDHMLTADPTGRYVFGVTQTGITILELYSVPLSIGNVRPAFVQPQAGQTLTIRGTGFVPGASVSVAGAKVAANYVDPNTLTISTPELNLGWADVAVTLPSGASYSAAALLQVISRRPHEPPGPPYRPHRPQ
jgi:hypothetical protein